ncbi:MAG TPA: YetF domain-containing protein [Acidobacteriaceae bacterium]
MFHTIMLSMFQMQLPWLEKILRPIVVYLVLIVFLRIFGKRELAQLNPFDLVVLLSLSNTVQNAIIGNDNSVSGGVIGAFALLAINWLLMRVLFKAPKITAAIEGTKTILVSNGTVDEAAMKKETLTHDDLISVLNKNGFNRAEDVKLCVLEPNGTFYVEGITPTPEAVHSSELMEAVRQMSQELRTLRTEIAAKG